MASPLAVLPDSSSNRQVWRFGVLCVAFVALWVVGSAYGVGTDSAFDMVLCHQLAAASAWGLRVLGWDASTDIVRPSLLMLDGRPSVIVGAPCDGLVLYALLAGFVLAYPGPTRRRLWFIPLSIMGLWLLNVVRIIALALNYRYSPDTFEFDHHYAFNAIAYAALGGLWLLWTRQTNFATTWAASSMASAPQPTAARQSWLTTRSVAGLSFILLLVVISILRDQILVLLNDVWANNILAAGPAWLLKLPGATPGAMPAGVSHLALPVGAAYTGFFIAASLLAMYLLLPSHGWKTVWRCYMGLVAAYVLLLLAGRAGAGQNAYRVSRMLLDFMVSLLPIAGFLVLLWRPAPTTEDAASTQPAVSLAGGD